VRRLRKDVYSPVDTFCGTRSTASKTRVSLSFFFFTLHLPYKLLRFLLYRRICAVKSTLPALEFRVLNCGTLCR
jgi:hypothetical protein